MDVIVYLIPSSRICSCTISSVLRLGRDRHQTRCPAIGQNPLPDPYRQYKTTIQFYVVEYPLCLAFFKGVTGIRTKPAISPAKGMVSVPHLPHPCLVNGILTRLSMVADFARSRSNRIACCWVFFCVGQSLFEPKNLVYA